MIGRRGEYSDAVEWPAVVFFDAAAAAERAQLATEHMKELAGDLEFVHRVFRGPLSPEDHERLAKYDPTLVYTIEGGPNAGATAAGLGAMQLYDDPPTYKAGTPRAYDLDVRARRDGRDRLAHITDSITLITRLSPWHYGLQNRHGACT